MITSAIQWYQLNKSTSSRQSSAMTISLLQDSFHSSRLREQSPWLRHQRWCSRSKREACSPLQALTLPSSCFLNKLIPHNSCFLTLSRYCLLVVYSQYWQHTTHFVWGWTFTSILQSYHPCCEYTTSHKLSLEWGLRTEILKQVSLKTSHIPLRLSWRNSSKVEGNVRSTLKA